MSDSQPRVLVVDDDPGVLQSLDLLLSDDCEVTVCDSPRDALEVAATKPFDVIISDYRMPHMTGAEFAQALQARVTPPPYTLLLTGTPDEIKPHMEGAANLVMVLAKPFEPARLLKLVLQVGRLGMNRRATPA